MSLPHTIALLAAVLAAGTTATPQGREPVWSYEVAAGPGGRELRIEARIDGGTTELTVDEGLGPFIQQAEVERGESWTLAERRGDRLLVPGCARGTCRVRYLFQLGQAAAEVHDRNRAFAQGGALLAPPSSWLARPVAGACRVRIASRSRRRRAAPS